MVLSVNVFDVLDDLAATLILEVDVDIGHLHALGREESLEHEAVGHRVKVGDAHGVGHDGTGGRAAARAHADALAARPFDVLLHDEEIRREALLDDDAHLVVGALLRVGRNRIAVTLDQALLHALAEPRLLGLALGQREPGKMESRSSTTSIFSATSTVLSQASGKSFMASRISSSVFM